MPDDGKTPYKLIYDRALSKIKDYYLASLDSADIYEILYDNLITAISSFHVCYQDLDDRDDVAELFNVELIGEEIEILSNYIVIDFVDSNYLRVAEILKMNMPSKDFATFSPARQLRELGRLRETYVKENDRRVSRYSYTHKQQ